MPTAENVVLVDANETPTRNSAAGSLYSSESYDQIVPAVRTPITAGSGGTQLQNIPCGKVWLRSASGNQLMFIGGVNEHAPFSGRGMSMYGNEIVTLPVKNSNVVSVMATQSGQWIEYVAFLAGDNVSIDISGIYQFHDTTAPYIVDISPTSGATGVPTNADIFVAFSEEMDMPTIDSSTFVVRLSGSSTPLSGAPVCVMGEESGCIAYFNPASGIIQTSKVYNAYVGRGVMDMAGNQLDTSGSWSWTTQAAPFLVSVVPTSGGSGIATDTDIIASFSQQMMSGTITNSAFTVRSGAVSTVNLSGNAFLDSNDPTQAVFVPASGIIKVSGTYVARLATSITDIYGNPLTQSGVWSFTTAAGAPPPDVTPPRVSGTIPTSGAISISGLNNITVNLSEQVQSGTVSTTNLFLRLSGNTIPATVSLASDLKTATIDPTSPLLNGKTYLINVLSGVKDLAGNFLSPYLSGKQFTTIPLTVSGYSPASGAEDITIGSAVYVKTSLPMYSGSINTTNCYIQASGATVPATVILQSGLKNVAISPISNLAYSQTYSLYVTSGAQDLNGNYLSNIISGQPFTTQDLVYNTVYNVAPTTFDNSLDIDKFRVGMRITAGSALIGKNVQKVTVYLRREGSPIAGSGMTIILTRAADGGVEQFGYKAPATVSSASGFTAYSFTNTSITHTLVLNDRIEVQWLSGTATARINVNRTNSNAYVGAIETVYAGATYSGAAYEVDDTTKDLAGVLYSTN